MNTKMKRGCKFSFHVSVVLIAIAYIYFSTVLVFIDQWFGLRSSPGMLNAAVFTLLAIMCISCYRNAVFTDPGRVPKSFVPDIEGADNPIHEIKRKGGDLRYCQKCSGYKPPRAHHCRVCNRCVLRMDHHCIWMNNCVGHGNYKIFFVFVFYAVIACIYSLVLLFGSLSVDSPEDPDTEENSWTIIYVISSQMFLFLNLYYYVALSHQKISIQVTSGLLLVPLSLALVFFLGWHIYLILQNKTTIEYHEGVRSMWLAEKGGEMYLHPYDVGVYENLTAILGPNIFCWFFPSSRHLDSGLRFRTRFDSLMGKTES